MGLHSAIDLALSPENQIVAVTLSKQEAEPAPFSSTNIIMVQGRSEAVSWSLVDRMAYFLLYLSIKYCV
jgi:hypothetical protein